jgi:ELWxxDGT repeat protein
MATYVRRWTTRVLPLVFVLFTSPWDVPVRSAQPPSDATLVKDIDDTFHWNGDSNPGAVRAAGAVGFFVADEGINGRELWRTDGTGTGTMLVKDINAGAAASTPAFLTNVNGTLFFTAEEPYTGRELWRSDGTSEGTVLVADLTAGAGSTPITALIAAKGMLFFVASRPDTGSELWKSDGTDGGTVLVKDIVPGAGSSSPQSLTHVGDAVFFSADHPDTGREAWKSDGTEAGTVLVRDINPGPAASTPASFVFLNGSVFFAAFHASTGRELWKTDGTADGTTLAGDVSPGVATGIHSGLWVAKGMVFFSGFRADVGGGLWRSDGTQAGTVLVKDVRPPDSPAQVVSLVEANGIIFFKVPNPYPYIGDYLWKSDGTEAGTVPFRRFSDVISFHPFGHHLFISTGTGQFLKTDGTLEGTESLSVNGFHHASVLGELNGALFFAAVHDDIGKELWKSDGTKAGTVLVKDINATVFRPRSSQSGELVRIGDKVFFAAERRDTGRELWKSDGTEAGTVLVKDIMPEAAGSSPRWLTRIGNTLFFTASHPATGAELWRTDGTAEGTMLVKDIYSGWMSSSPTRLMDLNGTLFFFATHPATGVELWKSDGTAAGTVLVRDVYPGPVSGPDINSGSFVNVRGILFFHASHPDTGKELWKSDGTEAGTVLVKDIIPGPGSSAGGYWWSSVGVGRTLFFQAFHPDTGYELWKSDGTEAGTVLVRDIVAGAGSSRPYPLADIGGMLIFAATEPATGQELWRTDGTEWGTAMIDEIVPGAGSTEVSRWASLDNALVFFASEPLRGYELWKTDGQTVNLVMDVNPGPAGSLKSCAPSEDDHARVVNGVYMFTADDGVRGTELWASDGNSARLVAELAPGSSSSCPRAFAAAGPLVFFAASDERTGDELWAIRKAAVARSARD